MYRTNFISKLFGILMALLAVQASAAGWEKVVEAPSGTSYYVQTPLIKKDGQYVTAWVLYDYKKPPPIFAVDGKPYLSTKTRIVYNCDNETWQPTSIANFTGHMGAGSVTVSRDLDGEAFHSLPDKYARKVWEFVCKP